MEPGERAAWRQADRLFAELIDLDPRERAQRLRELIIDDAVRERLLSLLASGEQDHGWLDRIDLQPPDWAAPATMGIDALPGRRFGAWQIESELGRGGMAVVYRARRVDGAADQVAALKLLTSGTLGRDGAERFRRETDILARLDHPHIVGLLDAGVAADGTPWLAMPLVEGVRIDDWCRDRDADTRTVVALFLQVCSAVASAHRSLVIHRDLKPSNVLVDRDGAVRLLDFGIARLANQPGDATGTQWRALTPDYAAPEQFQGQAPSTAMDIYGLGGLLYRLLVGHPPRQSAHAGAITRPSLAAAALADQAVPGRHQQALRRDLDRVLIKALAADPACRYGTVDEFVADLKRWLDGHPVLATAPGCGYRVRKFIARHRIGVAASVALVTLLLAGIAAIVWQAERARTQAERALAVRDLLVGVLQAADPTVAAGADPPASELLRRGAAQVRKTLADRPALLAELLLVIGSAQTNRAQLDDARRSLDDALDLHGSGAIDDPSMHAQTLHQSAQLAYEEGRIGKAIEQARAAAATAAMHGTGDIHDRIQVRLADLLVFNRQVDEAQALARGVIERVETGDSRPDHYYRALLVLGTAAEIAGDQDQAIAWLERAAGGFNQRTDGLRTLAGIQNTIGVAHLNAGRFEQARHALDKALAAQTQLFGADHPDTLATRSNLAGVRMLEGDPAAAIIEFERILPPQRALAGGQPHPDVAIVLGYLARARYLSGDTASALADAEAAHAELMGAATADHAGMEWITSLAGLLRLEQGQPDPERWLATARLTCGNLGQIRATTRWLCLAQALQAADNGTCQAPAASRPPTTADGLDGIERRWWTVHWLLHAQCGDPAQAGIAHAAITALSEGPPPAFPAWLRERVRTYAGHRDD